MTNASIFGGATLSAPPYKSDIDLVNIFVGHRFNMVGINDHWAAGVRCWAPFSTTADLSNCWGLLLSSSGTVLARKQFAATLGKDVWNDVLFDAAVLLDARATGYVAGVYMPHGGYAYREGAFTQSVPSADDAPHFIGIGGAGNNGVFYSGLVDGSTVTSLVLTSTSGTHYGTDVLIGAPHLGTTLSNTTAPAATPTTGVVAGSVLSCTTGTWAGSPSTFARQWRRAGVDIVGATSASYTVQEDDVGLAVTCAVVASGSAGAVRAISNAITPAPTTPPINVTPPSITPTTGVQVETPVSVSAGAWHQAPTSYSFQRQRDTGMGFANVGAPIVDTDGQIYYTPSPADQAYSTRFSVIATNVFGNSAIVFSNAVVPAAEPPLPGANARDHLLVDGEWVTIVYGTPIIAEHPPVYRPDINPDGTARDDWYGDGVTNDAVAWRAAIAEAFQAALDSGSRYYKIQHPGGMSYVAGLVPGLYSANAILPIPLVPTSEMKAIGELVGTGDQVTQHHWKQLAPQRAGCVIRTDTASTPSTTYGRPSVIGGPTDEQGYGGHSGEVAGGAMYSEWNNTLFRIDGITIEVPIDPHICGVDLRGMAQSNVENLAVLVPAIGAAPPAVSSIGDSSATQIWQFGLATPETNNNAKSWIGQFVGVGQNFACMPSEHTTAQHITALFCLAAVEVSSSGLSMAHGISIQSILAENCSVIVGCYEGHYPLDINIEQIRCESISFAAVNDPDNMLIGGGIKDIAGIGTDGQLRDSTEGSGYVIRGAGNLRIYDGARQKGIATSPAIPAEGVYIRNPFWRDCMVRIAGGSNADIRFKDRGETASQSWGTSPTTVMVPTGAYIGWERVSGSTPTAPTSWTWMVL